MFSPKRRSLCGTAAVHRFAPDRSYFDGSPVDVGFDLVISVVSISTLLLYARSLRTHFAASASMPRGAVLISIVVVATAVLFLFLLWTNTQPILSKTAGLILELMGLRLFQVTIRASRTAGLRLAFHAESPHSLVTDGPYRYLRHPFYASYLLFWVGWGIATWSLWSVAPVLAIGAIYVRAAVGEESKFSHSPMAAEYAAYRRRTGFFWPRWPG
jgi:protein-S-isoprenylcysteine O-methyltransferase Ste14